MRAVMFCNRAKCTEQVPVSSEGVLLSTYYNVVAYLNGRARIVKEYKKKIMYICIEKAYKHQEHIQPSCLVKRPRSQTLH